MVDAVIASAGDIFICVQASDKTIGIETVGDEPGLKSVAITSGDEFFCQFVVNLLAKSFFDHRTRRFAGPIAGNFGKPRKTVRDRVPFL